MSTGLDIDIKILMWPRKRYDEHRWTKHRWTSINYKKSREISRCTGMRWRKCCKVCQISHSFVADRIRSSKRDNIATSRLVSLRSEPFLTGSERRHLNKSWSWVDFPCTLFTTWGKDRKVGATMVYVEFLPMPIHWIQHRKQINAHCSGQQTTRFQPSCPDHSLATSTPFD